MMTEEQIKKMIEEGAAIRQQRLEKRQKLAVEQEKQNILSSPLAEADEYHRGLKLRLRRAIFELNAAIYKAKPLELNRIPEITGLFEFESDLDARVAVKLCRDEYCTLVTYCAYFKHGVMSALWVAAYKFWDRVLAFPEVCASGSLVLNLLHAGNIHPQVFDILKKYHAKFEETGLSMVILHTFKSFLQSGGYTDFTSGTLKKWSAAQVRSMMEVIELYEK